MNNIKNRTDNGKEQSKKEHRWHLTHIKHTQNAYSTVAKETNTKYVNIILTITSFYYPKINIYFIFYSFLILTWSIFGLSEGQGKLVCEENEKRKRDKIEEIKKMTSVKI